MYQSSSAAANLAVRSVSSPADLSRTNSLDGRPQRSRPLMRKYEVVHLNSSSEIEDSSHLAPALPAFEDSFASMGRGAILQTETGYCAVEDLLPGDRVMTTTNGFQTLLWHGSMTVIPGSQNKRPEMGTMTRLTAEAFGYGRPMPDLVLGPSARMTHQTPGVRTLTGRNTAFVPVRDFIDQSQIIELTPVTPVPVYQLGFEDHERLCVNGIEIESLHPGLPHMIGMKADLVATMMALFPHKRTLADFGPLLHPRIQLRDLDMFNAA